MVKNTIFIVFIVVISLFGIFMGWRYVSHLRDPDPNKTFLVPRIRLSHLEITSFTAAKTEVTAKIQILNQLPVSFTVDSVQFLVFIANTQVMQSSYRKALLIKGSDTSNISLPITVDNNDLLTVLKTNERKSVDSVAYRVQASFYLNVLFLKKFHVDVNTFQPLYHMLEITADQIKIDSLDFSRVVLRLMVTIRNQNGFSLRVKNIAYEFSIDKLEAIEGVMPGTKEIKAKSVTELQIPLRLPIKNVVKTLMRLLNDGKNAEYKLNLKAIVDSDNGLMKESKITVHSAGSVGSLQGSEKK